MRELPVSGGFVAMVDDDVYEWARLHRWSAMRRVHLCGRVTVYVRRSGPRPAKRGILLHREVMGADSGTEIDHINGDGLDNRRENLRFASGTQNHGNRRKAGGSSRFKGVSWHGQSRRWQAHIRPHGVGVYLGIYTDEADAARAYDEAARAQFGEFAALNFPLPGEQPALQESA